MSRGRNRAVLRWATVNSVFCCAPPSSSLVMMCATAAGVVISGSALQAVRQLFPLPDRILHGAMLPPAVSADGMNPPPLQFGQDGRQDAGPVPVEEHIGVADVADIRRQNLIIGTKDAGPFHPRPNLPEQDGRRNDHGRLVR